MSLAIRDMEKEIEVSMKKETDWEEACLQVEIADKNANAEDCLTKRYKSLKHKIWVTKPIDKIINHILKIVSFPQKSFNNAMLYLCKFFLKELRINQNLMQDQNMTIVKLISRNENISNDLIRLNHITDKLNEEISHLYNITDKIRYEMIGYIKELSAETRGYIKELSAETRENIKQERLELSYLKTKYSGLDLIVNDLTSGKKNISINNYEDMPIEINQNMDAILSSSYGHFEDFFRGTKQEVKSRQNQFLSIIDKSISETKNAPILDLGCGRGEWLELLKENGFTCSGVDMNREMVERCKLNGLDVQQENAIEYLKKLPTECLGGVTCFHVIEHLPFNDILLLLKHVIRVLKPGGVFIIETPNPENVTVSTYSFYLDPTHKKPLPAQLIKFAFETEGLIDVTIHYVNPCEDKEMIKDVPSELTNRFNRCFYGPQDYVVIAYKPPFDH